MTGLPPPAGGRADGSRAAASADVDPTAALGRDTVVWHLAQVREGAVVGERCSVGRGAYLGPGVRVGDDVKIQNYALVYEPAVLGRGVFVGPAAVLTNDRHPRAVDVHGHRKGAADWEPGGVTVAEGASLGAGCVCVGPVSIGRWAMVGAGAVVTADVPDHALVVGTPARRIAWVGRDGQRLDAETDGRWRSPGDGRSYVERDGALREAAS